jgi:flagellin-like hook-associated protein FlgL
MQIGSGSGTSLLTPSLARALADIREQGDRLRQQLVSGMVSNDYAGLGGGRTLALAVHAKSEAIDSYRATIDTVGVRLDMMTTVLGRFSDIGHEVAGDADPASIAFGGGAQTTNQKAAKLRFEEALELLNTEVAGRYLFGGRAVDDPPVESASAIIDGADGRAGYRQVMTERRQADLGADGRGRLAISPAAGGVFTIAEDGDHPFGFKLAGATSTLSNTAVTDPTGTPAQLGIAVSGQVNDGETLRVSLQLPDGSSEEIVLTAREVGAGANGAPAAGEFIIGATPGETAANLRGALDAAILKEGASSLPAASAMQASADFFDTGPGDPPLRIDGPPFATATALRAGTADDTVHWYKGDDGAGSPRETAVARIDSTVTIAYGVRASEAPLRKTIQAMAAFAASEFPASDADRNGNYAALALRTRQGLDLEGGISPADTVLMELGSIEKTIEAAEDRHLQNYAMLEESLANIEGVDREEVTMKLLSLQTVLQSSYEATAMLSRLSLVNFV